MWYHSQNFVERLAKMDSRDFMHWANMVICMARYDHKKIPYRQIGEAICKKIAASNTCTDIAKFFFAR